MDRDDDLSLGSNPGLVACGMTRSHVDCDIDSASGRVIPASSDDRHLSVTRRVRSVLQATRPRQWPKNVLVFAAPAAAGSITHLGLLGHAIAAFWIFVAASASTYLINDVVDRENDRRHPVKRSRPIASGELAPATAITVAAVLGAASIAGAALIGTYLTLITGAYLVVTIAYSLGLKRVPIVELACVGSGFTLRAVAGGAATHVPISPWFLVMTSFGALFIVAGKRSSEKSLLGTHQSLHRKVLDSYPTALLAVLRILAISVTVATYCLWAFERADELRRVDRSAGLIWFALSIIPFVLAVLALERAFERGRGGQPEELALSDHVLQFLGIAWVVLLLCGIYA